MHIFLAEFSNFAYYFLTLMSNAAFSLAHYLKVGHISKVKLNKRRCL